MEIVLVVDLLVIEGICQVCVMICVLQIENGLLYYYCVDIDGLQLDIQYVYCVQGNGSWSVWNQLCMLVVVDQLLILLYFGDIQNKNVSYVSCVVCVVQKVVLQVCMSLFVGDLVSGGDNMDDSEWGEWFVVISWLVQEMLVVLVIGNYEYFEEFEDILQECCVLGCYWLVMFVLLGNGVSVVQQISYWFDVQGVCVVVVDGILVFDFGIVMVQV